ncbi:MAG: gliding motility-associated C-terminal domain-containing protein [Bacteroidota bacterium]
MLKSICFCLFLGLNLGLLSAQTTDLSIAIEAQDLDGNTISQVDIYEDFQYVITISNSGNAVSNATISIDFDDELSIISSSSQNNSNGASDIDNIAITANVVTASIENMPNNASVELLVLVTAPTNLGGIAANGTVNPPPGTTDTNTGNNQSIISIDVLDVVIDFVVSHTQIQPTPGTAINDWGDEVTYQFTITNNSAIDFPIDSIDGKLLLSSTFDNGQPIAEFVSLDCIGATNGTLCPDLSNLNSMSSVIDASNITDAPSIFTLLQNFEVTSSGSITFELVYRYSNISCSPNPAPITVESVIVIGLNHENLSSSNSNNVTTNLINAELCPLTDICIETVQVDPEVSEPLQYDSNITLETTVCNNGPSEAPIRFFLQNLTPTIPWSIISLNCIETTGPVACDDFTLSDNGQIWVSSNFLLQPNTTITIETILQFAEPPCSTTQNAVQAIVRGAVNILNSQLVDTDPTNDLSTNNLNLPPAELCDENSLSDLQVTKTQISPALPTGSTAGDTAQWGEVVYEITVTNVGETDEAILIQDHMPVPSADDAPILATLTNLECTGTTGNATCLPINNAYIGVTFDGVTEDGSFDTFWEILSEDNWLLPANSSVSFTVTIDWQPECATQELFGFNFVRVNFANNANEVSFSNNVAFVKTFFAPCIDLIVQTYPEFTQVDTGGSFDWIVDVSNSTTSASAIDVLFENTLNSVFTVSGTPNCTVSAGNATCISSFNVDGNIISGTIPMMEPGSTISIRIPVTAPDFGGAFNNVAQAFPNPEDNEELTPDTNISINSVQIVSPVLDKFFMPDTIFEGDESELIFTIFNVASSPTQNGISFTDNLPAGLTLASAPTWVEANGCTATFSGNTGDTFVGVSDLTFPDAVESCTFSVMVTSDTAGTYLNNSQNISDTNNLDASQTSASLNVIVDTSNVDIAILKSVEPTEAIVGEQVIFTITAMNMGTTLGTDIEIIDLLPTGYEFILATASSGTFDANDFSWSLPSLAPGISESLSLSVSVISSNDLDNLAMLNSLNEVDRDPSNNEDNARVEISNCLAIPQGISPNGDRENDVLTIPCIESYPDNVIKIFNRYGTQIYEANNYMNSWDGRANMGFPNSSEPLPVGTYFYILEINGFERPLQGYIYINY